jgi:transcriptional regulator with XRE-family HTH domain
MDFYENVKQLVKTNNLTLRSFIESLGINYDSYNSCKKYNNLPRADEAVKIAQALNTTVEFLVTGEEINEDKQTLETIKTKLNEVLDLL